MQLLRTDGPTSIRLAFIVAMIFWLLEIGDEHTLQTPPDYSPDPNNERFIGHK
jgi:hypothetical protein